MGFELMHASQHDKNVYHELCSSRKVISVIGDKWSILFLTLLLAHTVLRFGEFKKCIEGISAKMTMQTLDKLVGLNLITRTAYDTKPLKVEYRLTALGTELGIILKQLTHWAEENTDALLGLAHIEPAA